VDAETPREPEAPAEAAVARARQRAETALWAAGDSAAAPRPTNAEEDSGERGRVSDGTCHRHGHDLGKEQRPPTATEPDVEAP